MTTILTRIPASHGVELALHDFGGPQDAPVVIWCHANGFASRSYEPLLDALARRVRVLALDARGHGLSSSPAPPYEESLALAVLWQDFAAAADHARQRWPLRRIFAAAHSLGALLPLRGLIEGDGRLAGAVLFDAAVFPPEGHAIHAEAVTTNSDRCVRIPRRKSAFASPALLQESLARAPAFSTMSPRALALHCEAALELRGDGLHHLRCRPDIEGFLYGEVARAGQYNELQRVEKPVLFVGGDAMHPGASWVTRLQPLLCERMPKGQFMSLRGVGHLLPMEMPERCAEIAADWILACE
jgi:pimeloyl-ACP methyl ester carboxylesterase